MYILFSLILLFAVGVTMEKYEGGGYFVIIIGNGIPPLSLIAFIYYFTSCLLNIKWSKSYKRNMFIFGLFLALLSISVLFI